MKLSELVKTVDKKKRLGQGISAGQGKTAGRGTKGQKSRTGKKIRPGFEGGQMPLAQRVPKKRGFNARALKPETVQLGKLNVLKDGEKVTLDVLFKARVIKKAPGGVKIVCGGKLEKKLTVMVPVTKTAAQEITKAGGKVEK